MIFRYIMTTHRNRPGVRLSKPGHWTNEPFTNEQQARAYAALDAGSAPFTIESEHITARLKEFPQ